MGDGDNLAVARRMGTRNEVKGRKLKHGCCRIVVVCLCELGLRGNGESKILEQIDAATMVVGGL